MTDIQRWAQPETWANREQDVPYMAQGMINEQRMGYIFVPIYGFADADGVLYRAYQWAEYLNPPGRYSMDAGVLTFIRQDGVVFRDLTLQATLDQFSGGDGQTIWWINRVFNPYHVCRDVPWAIQNDPRQKRGGIFIPPSAYVGGGSSIAWVIGYLDRPDLKPTP